ncbi:MAG: hypothetical protein HP497_08380 [Nitrospira sp.]|nr:hypothetical protein [Nitrospira sp.]
MALSNNDVAGLSQTPANVVDGGDSRQPVHRRPVDLTITVEKLDRALTDIQAQIEMLRQERTNLGLVRGELARMEAITGKVHETK